MARRCGLGEILALAGTFTSVMTVIIGLIYAAAKPPTLDFKWMACGWTNPDEYTLWVDCNQQWQSSWGMTALPNYTALIIGLVGVMMYQPQTLEVCGFPRNFVQYGLWLILQGFVGDFGYCGKLGVVVGCLSCILGVICFIAAAFDLKSARMLQIQKDFPTPLDELEEDDAQVAGVVAAGVAGVAGAAGVPYTNPDDLFDKLDKDGSGTLSREELAAAGIR